MLFILTLLENYSINLRKSVKDSKQIAPDWVDNSALFAFQPGAQP
jgi:hypothetical protein